MNSGKNSTYYLARIRELGCKDIDKIQDIQMKPIRIRKLLWFKRISKYF